MVIFMFIRLAANLKFQSTFRSTAGEAIKLIQAKRFCIFPNEGFRRQLYEYEPILRAKLGVPGSLERPEKRKERDEGGDEEPCDVDSWMKNWFVIKTFVNWMT